MVVIGFTGTREGMTLAQKEKVHIILTTSRAKFGDSIRWAHHGDCIGADEQFHNICTKLSIPTVVHPPDNSSLRAFCHGTKILEEKPYLVRNRDIVDACKFLIATPRGYKQERYSGTWATVWYARKVGREIFIVFPDGSVRAE